MPNKTFCLCLGLFSALHAQQPSVNTASSEGETMWIASAGGQRMKAKIYQSEKRTGQPVLILVLHGDSPFRPPTYQYTFAMRAANQLDNVVVAAILRPGYADGTGDQSSGERGMTTGDNYTPAVVDAIATVIQTLKAKFHAAAVILAGHSGGAAITGNLIGRHPAAVNAGLMVSCPCDLNAWRKHMMEVQANPIWRKPVISLSPIDLAGKVASSVRVRLIVGGKDPITPPVLTQRYVDALKASGSDVRVTVVPGLEHDILLEPAVFDLLKTLVRDVH